MSQSSPTTTTPKFAFTPTITPWPPSSNLFMYQRYRTKEYKLDVSLLSDSPTRRDTILLKRISIDSCLLFSPTTKVLAAKTCPCRFVLFCFVLCRAVRTFVEAAPGVIETRTFSDMFFYPPLYRNMPQDRDSTIRVRRMEGTFSIFFYNEVLSLSPV